MATPDYSRRFDAAVAELDYAGVSRSSDLPAYVKLGRKLGLEPRHPYYISPRTVAIFSGLLFAFLMGISKYLRNGGEQTLSLYFEIITAVLSGLFFGLFMASMHRRSRKKLRLSSWEDL
jgi:hypothetical protein